jgi:formylglycine-generating enzyme required for sulfatase activity
MMGEPGSYFEDAPEHKVRITKGFWLGKCEVTTAQWRRYLHEAGIQAWPGADPPTPGPDYPAWMINWEDATAYCRHYGLSLPAEAQWEYAAAGPEARDYPWGAKWDPQMCAHKDNPGPTGDAWPVGSFPQGASWCGALDMLGNVWEWCQDWYGCVYYRESPADDPPGPDAGEFRVLRGCSWQIKPGFRGGYRRARSASVSRKHAYGFRCAKTPQAPPS